jgi:hypothetical protein
MQLLEERLIEGVDAQPLGGRSSDRRCHSPTRRRCDGRDGGAGWRAVG